MSAATTPADFFGDPAIIETSLGPLDCHLLGHGRPLVLLHGLMVNALHWRHIVSLLRTDFRCVVPTLPLGSHARPLKDEADPSLGGITTAVEELMEALRLEDVVIVGSDTGSMLAQALMARDNSHVTGVVLLPGDTHESFRTWDARLCRQRDPQHRGLFDYQRLSKHGIPNDVIAGYTHPLTADSDVRRDLDHVLGSLEDPGAAAELADVGRFRGRLLLAWASEEPFFDVATARRLQRLVPGTELEVVADTYAYIAEDQPELLAILIQDWLRMRT